MLAAALCAAALVPDRPLAAATLTETPIERLVVLSDVVVIGTITGAEVFAGEMGRTTTRWTVAVEQTLRGEHQAQRTFVQWIGELDGTASYIPGDARLEVGDRMLLFLHGEPGELALTALSQAAWSVVDEPTFPPLPTTLVGRVAERPALALADAVVREPGARAVEVEVDVDWVERSGANVEIYDPATGEIRPAPSESMPLPEAIARIHAVAALLEVVE